MRTETKFSEVFIIFYFQNVLFKTILNGRKIIPHNEFNIREIQKIQRGGWSPSGYNSNLPHSLLGTSLTNPLLFCDIFINTLIYRICR